MTVKAIPYGPLGANLYVVEHMGHYLIIDPCVRPEKFDLGIEMDKVDAVLITHGHFDHIIYADKWIGEIKASGNSDVGLYIHSLDRHLLEDPSSNLSAEFGYSICAASVVKDISDLDGRTFPFGRPDGAKMSIIHTPGHSRGEVCIGLESDDSRLLFTGDMLFAGSVGRTDFEGSDPSDMRASIEKLKQLPDDTKVYPGHGPDSTIALEKQYNPYFR